MIGSRHRFAKVRVLSRHGSGWEHSRCCTGSVSLAGATHFVIWLGTCLLSHAHTYSHTHAHTQSVERQTLARQCPTLVTLIKKFPVSMSLQEPTFRDLVVVYRCVPRACGVTQQTGQRVAEPLRAAPHAAPFTHSAAVPLLVPDSPLHAGARCRRASPRLRLPTLPTRIRRSGCRASCSTGTSTSRWARRAVSACAACCCAVCLLPRVSCTLVGMEALQASWDGGTGMESSMLLVVPRMGFLPPTCCL